MTSTVGQVVNTNAHLLNLSELGHEQFRQAALTSDAVSVDSPRIVTAEKPSQLEESDIYRQIANMDKRVQRYKTVNDACLTVFPCLSKEPGSVVRISPDAKKVDHLADMLAALQVDERSVAGSEETFDNKWDRLIAMIDSSSQQNVEAYASVLEQYTNLYQGVSNVLSKFGKLVTTSSDNKMTVDFPKIKDMLSNVLSQAENNTIAGAVSNGLSKEQADQICKQLKLPDHCSVINHDSTYRVIPDVSQVRTMIDSLPDNNNLSVAHYNAWKSGFDAQMNRMEDALQDRTHKYSYTFSRFENFYKTISFIVQSMTDMLKTYLNAMRGA
jgi:type III secretion system IpaD/SipD/SspD family effector